MQCLRPLKARTSPVSQPSANNLFGLENIGLLGLFIGTFLAATVLPFSSDALYIAALAAGINPVATLVVGTAGNWMGGVTTYFIGRLGKWEWIEKHFKVKPESMARQKVYIDRYGVWMALISWVPFLGDVVALALGFFRTPAVQTILLLGVGKFARFAIWTLLIV